ncbi:hypothetical protein SAMN04488045_1078 [Thalassococcus halodurans]|uniref:Uncharacterized protein n=1 Tax=Thalassococcus halodurans TaxID=373675 RepID=A0A1H5VKC2_9RHOB|nr:hypothetical protein [Thalassococcus halodurans]SEF87653.1 hypothetical protein SAMN04488045_1078 [Thalassococcus halodurans]
MVPSSVSENNPFVFQAPITPRDHNLFMRYQGYFAFLPWMLMHGLWIAVLGLFWTKAISWILNTSAKIDDFDPNQLLTFGLLTLLLIGLTAHLLVQLKFVGIDLANFFGPLDRSGPTRTQGVSTGPREVALYPDRIEFKMENLNEVLPLNRLGKTKRFHDLLMIPAGGMRQHLLRPRLNASDVHLLKGLLRKTRKQSLTAPSFKPGYDLQTDPDAISPDRTKIKRAVEEWEKFKNMPNNSGWQSLFYLGLFAVCYPLFIEGTVSALNQGNLPNPIAMMSLFAMSVNLPRVLHEAFAFLNTKLGNGFPMNTNLGNEEFEPGFMHVVGDSVSVHRAGFILKVNLNSAIEAWEHNGLIIISEGNQPLAVLPARDDLKRALIRLGHLGFWGTPVEKKSHAPAPRALEVAPC